MRAVTLVVFFALGCASSGDAGAPAHLVTGVEDRVRQRINRIELVIDDVERAEKTVGVYLELEKLVIGYRESLVRDQGELWKLETDPATDDEALRVALAHSRENADGTWKKYVALQTQLRELLSKDEFERIDALR